MRYMTAKYNGTCSACGAATHAGDSIAWISRGVIECADCMPPRDAAPVAPRASQSQQFDAALTWDNSEPVAGASISDPNGRGVSAPVVERVRGRDTSMQSQRFIDTRCGEIVDSVPIHLIAHFEKYAGSRKVGEIDTGCELFQRANDKRNESEPVAAPVVDIATRRDTAEPVALDALSATVADLLVTLVNCIDRLDVDQCASVRGHAEQYSSGSDSGSRARIWQALARAVA